MKQICFYFQVHQPYRVSRYSIFDIGSEKEYFKGPSEAENKAIFEKVANKCYLPANKLFLNLLKAHPEFKISYSITGVFLEQCLNFGKIGKEVLESFKKLAQTGQVEFLAETYYHSLAALYNEEEFKFQVRKHARLLKKLFEIKPKVFRNTELIYNNRIAQLTNQMGFKGILLEGWDYVLEDRSPNQVYRVPEQVISGKKGQEFGLLLKNYRLSDDIAFRFSDKSWKEHPVSINKFIDWTYKNYGHNINLFMDYETFGEHQWEDTGIFKFLEKLPEACLKNHISFVTPSEAIKNANHKEELDIHHTISWADMERDLSAWLGNEMQQHSMKRIFDLEEKVKTLNKRNILEEWRKLQTSDHFYYMSTKYWSDGDVHKYFSPFESPYEAYMNYMNVVTDLEHKIEELENA